MKKLYNIEVPVSDIDIYDVLKSRGLEVESVNFRETGTGPDFRIISVIADGEDILALRLCHDIKLIDDPEAAGGFQTSYKLWKSKWKERLSKIVS